MASMTSRERLLAAIKHKETDRVAVAPRMPLWGLEQFKTFDWLTQLRTFGEFGCDALVDINSSLSAYVPYVFSGDYCDLDRVSVDISVENDGEANLITRHWRTPAGDLTDQIVQAHRWGKHGLSPSPTIREPLVKSIKDVEKVQFLLPKPEMLRGNCWPEMIKVIGERGLLQVHPRSMLSGMTQFLGMSECMMAFYDDRELFDALLRVLAEHFQAATRQILEWGAEIVFVSWHNFGVSSGWSPHIFREAFMPVIKANIDLVHSYGALYNYFDNGKVMPIVADIGSMGPDIISSLCPPTVGDVDLATVKRLIGDRVCLHGNVDAIIVVQQGTPQEVREATRQAIRVGAPGSGFILGNSDSFFMDTPRANIEAFFAAAREFGSQPVA